MKNLEYAKKPIIFALTKEEINQPRLKNTTMERFKYFYDGMEISKDEFTKHVPENWKQDLDPDGYYEFGKYLAEEF